jgi:di/tricarboxylate transporter
MKPPLVHSVLETYNKGSRRPQQSAEDTLLFLPDGGISLGTELPQTGAAPWLAEIAVDWFGLSSLSPLAILAALAAFLIVIRLGFILPVNSPQTMMAYGTGTFLAPDFVRTGLALTVLAYVLTLIFGTTYWRWLGYV